MTRRSPRHDLDNWLDRHGYRHSHARKQPSHPYAVSPRMDQATQKSSVTSEEGKWTFGAHPALIRVRRASIRLDQLIQGHREEVIRILEEDRPDSRWALDPDDVTHPPIVRSSDTGFGIVDGFHRMAGMVLHGTTKFPVIVVNAPRYVLDKIDDESEIGNHAELDAIYAAAEIAT